MTEETPGGTPVPAIEMKIKGLMMDPVSNMPIVLLYNEDEHKVLPIWVGVFEANAIALQIEKVQPPRPMTHDLLKNVITSMDARIVKIVVTELKENTYFAEIHLRRNGAELKIDARPSDAIALALRSESPIFVEEGVLDKAHTVDISSEGAESEKLKKWFESLDLKDLGKYTM
jgi:hypothetical protein